MNSIQLLFIYNFTMPYIVKTKNYMSFKPKAHLYFIIFILLSYSYQVVACSIYKITTYHNTIVGTNFDAYYTNPCIWFEVASKEQKYASCYSGGRIEGDQGISPQSGMNEAGLVFSRLAAATPISGIVDMKNKKTILKAAWFLKEILHQCKTIEEVKAFIEPFNHSYFIEDVFIYIDSTGRYLIVEPYTMTIGQDANYVLSNFCPSVTNQSYANRLERYRNGQLFLQLHPADTSLAYAKALIDTMHVCRNKMGDGTLLSSIWNIKNQTVTLYFYHDYSQQLQFDLSTEFKKGNHSLAITSLFPTNKEFKKLIDYKIPQNSPPLGIFTIISSFFFILCSCFYMIYFFRTKNKSTYTIWFVWQGIMNLLLAAYSIVLIRNMYIFYYDAPYKHYTSSILDYSGYIPFVLVAVSFPLCYMNMKIFSHQLLPKSIKIVYTINNLLYLVYIFLFMYWGLFDIWN